ncbi:helix-turn-helix transcriptional regulator [Candidatus Chloroploca asiatica]|uniref:helix-turn-helix transcriptional regulator n=1 Tax=Candidatus Chloroploca asiatica TaxID=1506545 RepID=UPI001FE3B370|nr:AlpA family transcriptional regulator [Candidatus Chloroploca asiatica]
MLADQGLGLTLIAAQVGLTRQTIVRWLKAGTFPARASLAPRAALLPLLDLSDSQPVPTHGLGCSCLAAQELKYQGNPALGRPALEGLVVGCLLVAHQLHLAV